LDYFDLGYFDQIRPFAETQEMFAKQIRDTTSDMFGIFDGRKLLAVGNYFYVSYSNYGTQVTIWVRKSSIGKGLGTYFMKRLTSHAIYCKGMNFVELMIDAKNTPSRRMAEKAGYELIEVNDTYTQGKLGSGQYCRYICFSDELNTLAMNYHKQPMDLIEHPAVKPEFRFLIHDEELNEHLKWPWPVLIKREHQGKPFGLVLEELQLEAELEELSWKNRPSEIPRPNIQLSRNLLAWR
jgi:RimJ/RimL family protein N-acetyltransferase